MVTDSENPRGRTRIGAVPGRNGSG